MSTPSLRSELLIFPDGHMVRRWGECDGCERDGVRHADCCRFVLLADRPLNPDEVNWLTLHPAMTVEWPRNQRFDIACSALAPDGSCALFGKPERPRICINYPEFAGLDARCSYTFEKVA